jgi:hypothetical protein
MKSFKADSKELSLLFAEFKKKLNLSLFTMKNYPQKFLGVIKMNFSVDTLQWMYHGCFTILQSPIDNQPSGLNAMNRILSVERCNGYVAW